MRRLWLLLVVGVLVVGCASKAVRYNARGNQQYDEGSYDEALESYGLAQVDQPDIAEPYYNAANAHSRLSNLDEATLQTEQALKTANDALAANAWYNLGNGHFDAKQWEQAIEAYRQALRLTPDDADAKHNLELAFANLQEQQAQQEGGSPDQENPEQGEKSETDEPGDSSEQQEEQQGQDASSQASATASPSPEEGASSSSPGEGATPTPPSAQANDEQQEPDAKLSPEQAVQLLRALIGDSQTLQERLQEATPVPGAAVEMDW